LYRFASVEAAERCIIALRQYRNLHPTFSKVRFLLSLALMYLSFRTLTNERLQQIHKIPGTIYAQVNTNMQGSDGNSSGYHWDGSDVFDDEEASFKARMEALADPTSTNLYMEGLPLSMDEPVRLLPLFVISFQIVDVMIVFTDSQCPRFAASCCEQPILPDEVE
jgi:hypothetical protein